MAIVRVASLFFFVAAFALAQTAIPPKFPENSRTVASDSTGPAPIVQSFPGHSDLRIAVWSIPATEKLDNISEVFVFRDRQNLEPYALWRSKLEATYAPTIEFVPGMKSEGLSVGIVFMQFGSAWGEIELIGRSGGRIHRLQRLMCSFYEAKTIDSSGRFYILLHENSDILDVPEIDSWNGHMLVDVSRAHPDFYRKLLAEDEKEDYQEWRGGTGLFALARIASLARDPTEEESLLQLARKHEIDRGNESGPQLQREIRRRLKILSAR